METTTTTNSVSSISSTTTPKSLSYEKIIDSNGTKVYIIREYIQSKVATELFKKLQNEVKWNQEPIILAGREVMQARLTYGMGDDGFTHQYGGINRVLHPWIPEVKEILDKIKEDLPQFTFNSCLLNYYRDGSDYIGYHSDKEALGLLNSVISISLGGSRDFYFKPKNINNKETIKTTLHNGDFVLMLGNCQRDYTHSIPKRAKAESRISITFRLLSVN
jgi:alkylated DNA repair dioxygenase AlkB